MIFLFWFQHMKYAYPVLFSLKYSINTSKTVWTPWQGNVWAIARSKSHRLEYRILGFLRTCERETNRGPASTFRCPKHSTPPFLQGPFGFAGMNNVFHCKTKNRQFNNILRLLSQKMDFKLDLIFLPDSV